ncbi:MAG: lipoyl synthase [Deltaproteobacteria bacterium]|nr:lipoyl synthase [Deltaproteobacteria bacterium]
MSDLIQNGVPKRGTGARRPEYLRVKIQGSTTYREVGQLLGGLKLHTVCESARCPNIWECWGSHKTATFMIAGDVCTRNCRYCAVTKGRPEPLATDEPAQVAKAVWQLKLAHAVVTSVDRDDLADFGAGQFAATIRAIRTLSPTTRVEVLIPDLKGDAAALQTILDARPEVLNHNVETVPRLFPKLRAKGDFERSLTLLARADAFRREHGVPMVTKSGIMLGLGETIDELLAVMDALRRVRCDVLTLGQYLNPTTDHTPIDRFYTLEEFATLRAAGQERGFAHVEAGPLVRSSYHAASHVPTATA